MAAFGTKNVHIELMLEIPAILNFLMQDYYGGVGSELEKYVFCLMEAIEGEEKENLEIPCNITVLELPNSKTVVI